VLDLRQFGGKAAQTVSGWTGADAVRVVIPDAADLARDAAEAALGAKLGSYDFGKWADDTKKDPLNLAFLSGDADAATSFARDQAAVMDGVKLARDLISTPSNIKSPQWFVETTRVAFKDVRNVRIEVLDEREMARLGMGAILGVGQGSTRPPRVLIIRYDGGPAGEAPLAFVGKGITFDTGGISIKPGDGMWRMRYDMSGAAASVGSLLTIAKRGAKVNAVAVSALAENMTDGNAIRPGDVLTSMSGKTIEVLNTDAEGRLVLADGLWLAQERFKPKLAVTIATLTGAVRTALGTNYAGLFSHDDAVAARIEAAAKASGEAVWRLPIHNDVIDAMKTPIADVKNVVEGGTVPGASLGAAFIMEWAKPETAFAHLDIAGMAWTTSANATTPAGAAGYGVLLFDSLTRSYEAEAK
jgi:leucyl aminopeptidase